MTECFTEVYLVGVPAYSVHQKFTYIEKYSSELNSWLIYLKMQARMFVTAHSTLIYQ